VGAAHATRLIHQRCAVPRLVLAGITPDGKMIPPPANPARPGASAMNEKGRCFTRRIKALERRRCTALLKPQLQGHPMATSGMTARPTWARARPIPRPTAASISRRKRIAAGAAGDPSALPEGKGSRRAASSSTTPRQVRPFAGSFSLRIKPSKWSATFGKSRRRLSRQRASRSAPARQRHRAGASR